MNTSMNTEYQFTNISAACRRRIFNRKTVWKLFPGFLFIFVICSYLIMEKRILKFGIQDPPIYAPRSSMPMVKWFIATGMRDESLPEVCKLASKKLPNWHIALGTHDNKRVHDCSTNTSIPVSEMSSGIPDNRIAKNPLLAAVLHAIKQGGDAIYLPPKLWMDSTLISPGIKTDTLFTGLLYRENSRQEQSSSLKFSYFAHLQHFGCTETKHKEENQLKYDICEQEVPAIQAPITVPVSVENNHMLCDPRAPAISLPENVYVDDLQIQTALYTKKAFWALVFPALMGEHNFPNRALPVLKIVIQRVLWNLGTRIMLWHNDYNEEALQTINITTPEMKPSIMKQVQNVQCTKNDIRNCVSKHLDILKREIFITSAVADTVISWIDMLMHLNVEMNTTVKEDICKCKSVFYHSVNYSKQWNATAASVPYVPITNLELIQRKYDFLCEDIKMSSNVRVNFTHPWQQFSDILLVVVFNLPHYEAIPFVEVLYRPFFPYILYCGPGLPSANMTKYLQQYKYSFVNYPKAPKIVLSGPFKYRCITLAMSMSYSVIGYAVVGDDVLLSMSKLVKLPPGNVWFVGPSVYRIYDVYEGQLCTKSYCPDDTPWVWWRYCRNEIIAGMETLRKCHFTNDLCLRCYNNLKQFTGSGDRVIFSHNDFYYIPQRLAKDFIPLAWLFMSQNTFVEVVIPTLLSCLEDPNNMAQMSPMYIWGEPRMSPWLHFNKNFQSKTFLHPTKWGPILKSNQELQNFYCNKALPFLHDPLGRVQ